MNSKRIFFGMLGLLVLLTGLVAGSVILGDKMMQKQSSKLVEVKLEDRLLQEQQTALIQASNDIKKYSTLQQIAQTIVPEDKDQARAVREIISYAQAANIPIDSVTFPSSSLGQVVPKASSSTAATPLTQVNPVSGVSGLYEMPITVVSKLDSPIAFGQLVTFLASLENNRRTAQVVSIVITPSSLNPKLLTFTLIINVYLKP